jgi:hypothetical protein
VKGWWKEGRKVKRAFVNRSTRTGKTAERLSLCLLRAAILDFAVGLAFLLDDPARHTTTTVPTPGPVRIALRVALAAPAATAAVRFSEAARPGLPSRAGC